MIRKVHTTLEQRPYRGAMCRAGARDRVAGGRKALFFIVDPLFLMEKKAI
jgi:hypothetical protein